MNNNDCPITPPMELVEQWARPGSINGRDLYIADQAANWGYKQAVEELKAFLKNQQ